MQENPPYISVVICTYNRDKFIRSALESLTRQTLPSSRFEVLVVDNNSTDQTAAICQAFIAETSQQNFFYHFEPNKGLSSARNRGIKEARGEVITYIDDDAIATEGFLQELFDFFTNHPGAAGAGGKVIPIYPGEAEPAWMNKYLYGFVTRQDFGGEKMKYTPRMKYPAGCNMSYRKNILEKVNGFNEELHFRSDDKLINFRVRKFSDDIWYIPGAMVYHHIDGERLQFISFKKLYQKTGNEEKKRILSEKNAFVWLGKLAEYVIKLGVSLLLWIGFAARGTGVKGRYLFYSQWFTLSGFLKKNVFVR